MGQLKNTYQNNSQNQISLEVYLQFISEIKQIDAEKENELIQRIGENDTDALKELVEANLGLVVSIAKQYQELGLSLRDLILEGNLGLISAANRLVSSQEFNFKTFASKWIDQSIFQAITEYFWISRLSFNQNVYKNRIDKVLHQLSRNFANQLSMNCSKYRSNSFAWFTGNI
ncbi:hypothetical protein GM418_21360 [Maribellus comscasis]|uniref:RNA polymerase sigma-70 region 2 domain-containing protein n=1 Tax=Maribellus comscasis TaxID=2681766 RepID=A0A6I6K128_9BACT|nr:sigma factor [Maribellus comscasis]QGY46122.1 hypothetical protein GM418_21360 [Maribellus comscasis]